MKCHLEQQKKKNKMSTEGKKLVKACINAYLAQKALELKETCKEDFEQESENNERNIV